MGGMARHMEGAARMKEAVLWAILAIIAIAVVAAFL